MSFGEVAASADAETLILAEHAFLTEEKRLGEQTFRLAGGQNARMDVSGQMELCWRDRRIELDAAIAPSGANNLLSITVMELLDIMPAPSKGCLVGIHGDEYINELE